jgi:Ca-activated chloride channel family protein
LDEVYQEIDKLERSKIEVTEFRRLHEEFYPLVAWALALLLLEFLLRKTIFRTLTD